MFGTKTKRSSFSSKKHKNETNITSFQNNLTIIKLFHWRFTFERKRYKNCLGEPIVNTSKVIPKIVKIEKRIFVRFIWRIRSNYS
jgi:hypothetical protein